jgi:L-threonylcarbamoyladenylate synthase
LIRLRVDPGAPDPALIARAAEVIRAGGVAAIPTDTLYGLAASALSGAAVARVFDVKGRAADRALPLVAGDLAQVRRYFGALPPIGAQLAARFWPGPLTLLLPAPDGLPQDVTGGRETVGVRVPAHAVTTALCLACDVPLTATSANLTGEPPTDDADSVARTLGDRIDVLVDAGRTPGGAASTIVDVAGPEPRLVRAGAIAWEEVRGCLRGV